MTQSFNIVSNLPAIIFAFFFLISFILFLWAEITLLRAKKRLEKLEKGRKLLLRAFILFFIVLLVTLVFYLVSYLLQRWYTSEVRIGRGEFPVSPSVGFPSAPDFINIEGYYFRGPYPLSDVDFVPGKCVYAVLCPRDENYDIIYLGAGSGMKLSNLEGRSCWFENCSKELYFAVLWTPMESYGVMENKNIRDDLEKKINPPCLLE